MQFDDWKLLAKFLEAGTRKWVLNVWCNHYVDQKMGAVCIRHAVFLCPGWFKGYILLISPSCGIKNICRWRAEVWLYVHLFFPLLVFNLNFQEQLMVTACFCYWSYCFTATSILVVWILTNLFVQVVPDDASKLADFHTVMNTSSEFEIVLKEVMFISESDKNDQRLSNFADNVEAHFAVRKKAEILAKARQLILQFDFTIPLVSPK